MAVPERVPGPAAAAWRVRGSTISLDEPVVMGILNLTPDSFSDGGVHATTAEAVDAGLAMVADGAAIVDVGGESTRPGADSVSAEVEIARVARVIERLAAEGVVVSVDTSKPKVAQAAIDHGAAVVNDVTGLSDVALREVCADTGVGVVIMHMQGVPKTMQVDPHYEDVVSEVKASLERMARAALDAGMERDSIVIDPGIGFGKNFAHNVELMAHLDVLTGIGYPLMIGTSRKGFLGKILEPIRGRTAPHERDGATAATVAMAVAAGVRILRVHNVRLAVEVAHTVDGMVPVDHGKEINRT